MSISGFTSRIVLLVLVLSTPFLASAQGIRIGDYKAVQDKASDQWLCCVPRQVFGTDWTVTVLPDSTWSHLTFLANATSSGETTTFHHIEGGKLFPFTATVGDSAINGNVTFTWLPIMELDGDIGFDYSEGSVSVNTADSTSKDNMRAKLKWRGNHSNDSSKHKRNYSIKFLDKNGGKKNRSLLGMRKDNHWKLDGGQSDPLRVRNRVITDLWLDMARAPWHQDLDSSAVNGSHGKITEVFLNGNYIGIYNLMEPIDRKQLALVKYDTVRNEFHGQMWCVKTWCRTGTMSQPIEWSNDSETWDGIEVSYPDFEEVCPTDWSTLANAVTFIKQTDVDDKWIEHDDSLDVYFDMPVMQDYFILIATMQLIDNESKNLYYSVFDKTIDHRLTMTPWDLNVGAGARSIPYMTPPMISPERPLNWISHIPMYAMFNISNRLRQQVIDRYWELRKTWLDTDSLVNRFQRAVDELQQCGAVAREEARWKGDSDLGNQELDFNAEMEYIADWIRRRMAYLDTNVFIRPIDITGDMNGDHEVSVADINWVINDIVTGANSSNCDVDGDGEVSINDVNRIISIIVKH